MKRRFLSSLACLALVTSSEAALLVYYTFDEGTGATVDNQGTLGAAADGIISGGGTWISGAPSRSGGGAYDIPESNVIRVDTQQTATALGVAGTGGYTLGGWMRFDTNSGDNFVFSQPGAGSILHHGIRGNGLHFGHWGNDVTAGDVDGPANNMLGQWRHVTYKYTSDFSETPSLDNRALIYENGRYVGSENRGALIAAGNASNVWVGGAGPANWGMDGAVDDIAMYNTPLTSNQIAFLANGGDPLNLAAPSVRDRIGITPSGYRIRTVVASTPGSITNLAAADNLLAGLAPSLSSFTASNVLSVNFLNTGADGNFGANSLFPGLVGGVDDFAMSAQSVLHVLEADYYTFGHNTDDGGRLRINGSNVFINDVQSGPHNFFGGLFLAPGYYNLDYTFFERSGGEEAELFVAAGSTPDTWFLLNSLTVPEPDRFLLFAFGMSLAVCRRTRPRH